MCLSACVLIALAAGTAAGDAPAAPPPNLKEVVVVFKTHYDLGYTDLASDVIENYKTTMIDKALDVCDASRALPPEQRFVWTIPGWPMAEILGAGPERRARVMEALRDGYFVTHALPFTTHTESLELEDLVRGLRFASNIARECGKELARDAKMTDVPSHSWVLPTLLKHAGVDFLHIGCNGASAYPDVPPLFWWEGPDGSRVLTRYDKEYGSPLVPPADWPYPVWLALIHTGDNQGPPNSEDVAKLLEQARQELPGVKVRMGRLSDFSDALLAGNPEIPIVRGDMPDTWIHGIMSMPAETAKARNLRPAIAALEQLDVLLSPGGQPNEIVAAQIADAYEHSLLFGEHTWGMDAKQFPRAYGEDWQRRLAAGEYKKATDSWAEKGRHVEYLDAIGQELNARVASLADAFGGSVVYNSLPWPRKLGAEEIPAGGYRIFDKAPDGTPATDLAIDEAARAIENRFFRVAVDPERGGICSWIDKRTGRELIAQHEAAGFNNYLYERFSQADVDRYMSAYCRMKAEWVEGDFGKPGISPDAPHEDFSIQRGSVRFERNPDFVRAVLEGESGPGTPHKVVLAVTLRAESPYVDVSCSVNVKPDPWPAAGWLSFAFALEQPRFLLGRLGGLVDPAKDAVRGANHDVYCLNTGMAVIGNDGTAIGLCPLDAPVVSLERPGLLRYTPDFQPTQPKVFLNLFNNVWGTNFAQWCDPLPPEWRVRLWVMDSGNGARERVAEDLVRNSWEARAPLISAQSGKPCAKTFGRRGLAVSKPGVIVTAFGPNPDGEGFVLRLWDQAGEDGDCTVTLPEGYRADSVQPCDLRGRPRGPALAVSGNAFSIPLHGNAPASFLLPQ
jgi:alpha-mannosidase